PAARKHLRTGSSKWALRADGQPVKGYRMSFLFVNWPPVVGYITLGVLAFVFGVLVTLLCIRLRDLREEKKHE
ncbi:MAG: hypothetical protein J5712_01475, partial [Lachnospiraceae bacterium]|nr:hypothetical protein [Lachnospiraceae bacterium]